MKRLTIYAYLQATRSCSVILKISTEDSIVLLVLYTRLIRQGLQNPSCLPTPINQCRLIAQKSSCTISVSPIQCTSIKNTTGKEGQEKDIISPWKLWGIITYSQQLVTHFEMRSIMGWLRFHTLIHIVLQMPYSASIWERLIIPHCFPKAHIINIQEGGANTLTLIK